MIEVDSRFRGNDDPRRSSMNEAVFRNGYGLPEVEFENL